MTPSRLGRRYLPFIVLAAVQLLLVAVAPSSGPLAGSGRQVVAGGRNSAGNAAGAGGNGTVKATGGPSGSESRAGGSSAGGAGGVGGGAGGVGGGEGGAAGQDLSRCDPKTGKQIGPLTDSTATNWLLPDCLPVFTGQNGGETMTGVTATTINFVTFQIKGDPTFNALAGASGLQSTPEQWCEGQQAFTQEIQKRWELWGRKLVSLDGPGANAGSTQQSPCHFPYWQSQCNNGPPDEPCFRAEARVIAGMHPAMVLATTLDPALFDELTKNGVIAITTATTPFPLASYEQAAPYFYSTFMDGTRLATFDAEYWCKKLSNKPAIHAGVDVTTTRNWGPAPGVPPTRKIGIIFPEDPGNTGNKQNVDVFTNLVSGGPGSLCNTAGGVFQFPVASDPSQLATQTNTAINALLQNHITDVVLWCDPLVCPETFTNTAAANNYYPEYFVVGQGLIDDNQLAQLYNQAEWSHALGVSSLWTMVPFDQSDATRAWQDVGNSGTPATDQALYIYPYMFLGTAFMAAGPSPTPWGIHDALVALGNNGGWAKLHDPRVAQWGLDQQSPWTFEEDVREVYWSPTRTAEDNGKSGSYCPVAGGQRYGPGEFTTDDSGLFETSGC